ncbi:MAG: neutral/alkaline non-lysosomal ceramidase N-terminal domain-containing protein, partial [Acidobacteria bacterium]|nr:neutral/alkaline non-lysosomal ceramidase N-terminal domain-containing protein [Acidobacteriota bacterium]
GVSWRLLAATLVAGSLSAAHAQGAAGWKAGVAKVVITPAGPIWMAGYGARTKPSEGVRQDLHAKALALQDETGVNTVLVTLDLVGIKRELSDQIAERCRRQFGLPRDRLALNFSHTHSGPVTGRPPPYADVNKEQEEVIRRYTAELLDKVVDVVGRSIRDLSPATLSFEQGLAAIGVNRRRVRLRALPGPVDHDVPVLCVRGPNREVRAIVAGYACHATSLGDYQIGGDWPGFAQAELEKRHAGATAMFVQGCGADSNPLPRYQGTDPALLHYSVEMAASFGKVLAAAVDLVVHGKMKPIGGPLRTAIEPVAIPYQRLPTREELQTRIKDKGLSERRSAERLLAVLDRDGRLPSHLQYPVQVWQFGSDLLFVALGGEVVVDYSLRLKAQHGWDRTWVAGYSNEVPGYIPSLRVLKEGGYEGGDANRDLPGLFSAAIEEMIVEKVNDLVGRTRLAR